MLSKAMASSIPREVLISSVKWASSIVQIMGYATTAFGWMPWNLYFFIAGVFGWFTVGLLWNDRALMLVHLVALGAIIAGMTSS